MSDLIAAAIYLGALALFMLICGVFLGALLIQERRAARRRRP